MSLSGKVVMITGAASGIGRAQAARFLAEGAKVIGIDINEVGLQEVEAERPVGSDWHGITADLRQKQDIARVVGTGLQLHGRIDILSNTAGILDGYTRSLDTSDELWDRVFAVNVTSVFRLTNAVLPGMIDRGRGTVINMASVASVIAGGGGAAYTASKHALLGYTRQLASDYGRHGIKANAICPGMIESAMTRDKLADKDSRFVKAVTGVPIGRYGQPDDIAGVAIFLAKVDSDFMQGAAVMVDGGLTIR